MWVVVAGLSAGAVHAVAGPDHLLALAPLSLQGRNRSWVLGLRWGLGHGAGTLIVVPLTWWLWSVAEGLSAWGERLGGLTLIVAGILLFRTLWQLRGSGPLVSGGASAGGQGARWEGRAAASVGLIHGLAGGLSVAALLPALRSRFPALASEPWGPALYLGGFALGSTLAMAALTAALGVVFRRRRAFQRSAVRGSGEVRWRRAARDAGRTTGAWLRNLTGGVLALASIGLGVMWLVAPGSAL
jgi:hypothetical protein